MRKTPYLCTQKNKKKEKVMKNRMYRRMQMCCCCDSMRMLNSEKRIKVHIINIYNERERHEKNSIYDSIASGAAS